MQQKVAPDRILELAANMKQLRQKLGSETSKKFTEIQSLANDTRYVYSESYVRSIVFDIESLLRELRTLSESVIHQLEKKEAALRWTAEKYRKTEEESAAKLKLSELSVVKRNIGELFTGLLDAAKKNVGVSGKEPSKLGSFMKIFMGVMLEIQEDSFIDRVQLFKDDPKISGLIEILNSGTPVEQQIARQQLGQIAFAFSEISRNQVAYDIYKTFDNVEYMQEASRIADAQRRKLIELGVSEEWYNPEVDLSDQYKDTPLSALKYNPLKNDHSPMPVEKQLQLVIELGLRNEAYRYYAKAHYPEIEIAVKQAILAEQEAKRIAEEAARLAEEEASKNMFEKSWDSIKEIGSDFYLGMVDRNNKKFDSFYDFGNYLTSGAFDSVGGFVDGLEERGDKAFDSTYDFFNWLTIGTIDTVNGAINPDEPFSKEHWLNSLGVVSLIFGVRGAVVSKTEGSVLPNSGYQKGIKDNKSNSTVKELNHRQNVEASFNEIRSGMLNKYNLSLMQFQELRLKPTELLSEAEVQMIKDIRRAVPALTEDTLMQKVLPPDAENWLFKSPDGGNQISLGGYVARVTDTTELNTFDKIFEGLRLDYEGNPYVNGDAALAVRYKATTPESYKIPFGGKTPEAVKRMSENDLSDDYVPTQQKSPYTGNGFTESKEFIVPEYLNELRTPLTEGAELYQITAQGEKLIGVYSEDYKRFLKLDELGGDGK